jgi:hypothetical protein
MTRLMNMLAAFLLKILTTLVRAHANMLEGVSPEFSALQ